MLGKNNTAGDNSSIVSTTGSNNTTSIVNNHVDVAMVELIVKGILHDSLPVFQEAAREKVLAATQEYIDSLVRELVAQKTPENKINEKLPSPDIQYSIYETAKAYAKSTARTDKGMLINLVVQKINADEEDYDELTMLDMAIEAASKLAINQIKFLSFVNYIGNVAKFGVADDGSIEVMDPFSSKNMVANEGEYIFGGKVKRDKAHIESLYVNLYTDELEKAFPKGDLTRVNFNISMALGCITVSPLQKVEVVSIIKKRTGLDLTDQHHAERLKPLVERLDIYGGIEDFSRIVITSIGQKVAAAYLSTRIQLHNF